MSTGAPDVPATMYDKQGRVFLSRPDDENRIMAERFKAMLINNSTSPPDKSEHIKYDHPTFQPPSPIEVTAPSTLQVTRQETAVPYDKSDLLAEAFRRDYSQPEERTHNLSYGGGPDQTNIWRAQHNHLLIGDAPPSMSQDTSLVFRAPPQSGSTGARVLSASGPFVASRHTEDRSFSSGTSALPTQAEERIRQEHQRRAGARHRGDRGLRGGETAINRPYGYASGSEVPTEAPQHAVSLAADLPPLAVEHPARVWNSMIHSLNSNLQPIVKWDYDRLRGCRVD